MLVVQQSFMHCWRAAIDGRPAVVEPANGVVLGVRVPAGRHEVELRISPTPYLLGLLGPVFLAIAVLLVTRPKKQS